MTKKLSSIMKDFLYESPGMENKLFESTSPYRCGNSSPVVPISSKDAWNVVSDPNRLHKVYKFNNRENVKDFVTAVLDFEDHMKHHGEIKVSRDSVMIEVYTHTVNDVTESDIEYAKNIDQVYQDILYYRLPE